MSNDLPGSLCAAILNQSADAIIYADREGCIQLWNAAAEQLFGFPEAEVLGKSLDVMIPERLRDAHWIGYNKAMKQGVTKHSGKPMLTKSLHKSGSIVYVEMSFSVVTDADRATTGSVAIARVARQNKASQ